MDSASGPIASASNFKLRHYPEMASALVGLYCGIRKRAELSDDNLAQLRERGKRLAETCTLRRHRRAPFRSYRRLQRRSSPRTPRARNETPADGTRQIDRKRRLGKR